MEPDKPLALAAGIKALLKSLLFLSLYYLDSLDIATSSLKDGYLPQSLKEAHITPIWKGGDRTLPANYRPVALTPHLSKVI